MSVLVAAGLTAFAATRRPLTYPPYLGLPFLDPHHLQTRGSRTDSQPLSASCLLHLAEPPWGTSTKVSSLPALRSWAAGKMAFQQRLRQRMDSYSRRPPTKYRSSSTDYALSGDSCSNAVAGLLQPSTGARAAAGLARGKTSTRCKPGIAGR